MSQKTVTFPATEPIDTGDSFSFAYPFGYSSVDFSTAGHYIVSHAQHSKYTLAEGAIEIVFGVSEVEITYLGGTTIPLGSLVFCNLQLKEATSSIEVDNPQDHDLGSVVYARDYGVVAGADATTTTSQIRQALNAVAGLGGRCILQLPAGDINVTASDVAAGEGTAFQLTASHSGIWVKGRGRSVTRLVSATNKVEMWAQAGAENVAFSDITFVSPSILQNQPKGGALTQIGGGVAKLGNGANAAIRQYFGAGLTLRRLGFNRFGICSHYIGTYTDDQVLSGDVVVDDMIYDEYIQGLLIEEPRTIRFENIWSRGSVNSINADATLDPGHAIYISNRLGVHPERVVVSNIMDTGSFSSCVKVRKGRTVVVQGVTVFESNRGVEINNCERAVVSNLSVKIAEVTDTDTNRCGLIFDNGGTFDISNVFVDVQGVDSWGVRLRPDPVANSIPANPNKYGRISNVTVMADFAVPGKACINVNTQSDLTIENFRLVHVGSASNSRHPIQVVDSARVHVIHPSHITGDTPPADAENLVSLDATCVDCSVIYSTADLSVAPTGSTVSDIGTGTDIVQVNLVTFADGHVETPSIAFTNDLDCGFWKAGTNVWAAAAGGIEQMRFFTDRVTISTNLRPATDGALYLGFAGFGWRGVVLTPQTTTPSSIQGNLAISDGTADVNNFGVAGAGLYRFDGAAWVFIG